MVLTRYHLAMDTELHRLLELIERLGGVLRAVQRECAAAHGLQPVHLEILDYLYRCNRFSDTPVAIAAYLGITKGSVSQSIRQIEARGLVRKLPDAQDRRKVHVRLTREGRVVLRRCAGAGGRGADDAGLDSASVRGVTATLMRLLIHLQDAHGRRMFGQCRNCRHLTGERGAYRCGLTGVTLDADDTRRICYEYEARPAEAVPG